MDNATRDKTASGQQTRMRSAIERAVTPGPRFLRGEIDADHMAEAMVAAVRAYVELERALGSDGRPQDRQNEALYQVLGELLACGSGYLAGRCDGACVARTMTAMVEEFGEAH